MTVIKLFLNDPFGKTWTHFQEMIPRLGKKYDIKIETISKSRNEYQKEEYISLHLPVAPAIAVGNELIVQGQDIDENILDTAICRILGIK